MSLKTLWHVIKATFLEWWNDNTFRLAASLAFYTTFSLAPILVIAVSITGLVFTQEHATNQIVQQVERLAGPQGADVVVQILKSSSEGGGGPIATILGVVTLVIGSTAVFVELQSALNHVWDVQTDPKASVLKELIRDRLRSFTIVVAVGFLLLVSLLISAGLAGAQTFMAGTIRGVPWLWRGFNFIASFVVISLLFAMVYRYLPDVKITWRDVSVGSMVTALLFTGGKYLIGLYLGHMTLGSSYGAAGSFVVMLIWVYYSALICFFGAEFTQVYARRYGSKIRPQPHAVRVGRKEDGI